MTLPDWREAEDYAPLAALSPAAWAWEFLRRNPDYQQDYAWFITTWNALERDYGSPPQRDFHRWRQDPRAWRAGSEGEDLLIECWMAERWGLARFPLDPARPALQLDAPPAWHELPLSPVSPATHDGTVDDYQLNMRVDLRAPLDAQLESARRMLAARQQQLRWEHLLLPAAGSSRIAALICSLRLLDAAARGVAPAEALERIGGDGRLDTAPAERLYARAEALRDRDYRFLVVDSGK